MGSGTVRRRFGAVVAATLLLGGCWFGGDDDAEPLPPLDTSPPTSIDDGPVVNVEGAADPATNPLGIELGNGESVEAAVDPVEVVTGTPLESDEVRAVLDRLPPWNVPPDDTTEFARPAETLPPPIPGEVVDTTFPPDGGTQPVVPEGPLGIVRFQPEGPVDVAPFVTVTFDQPMVPVATVDQLAAADVPLQLTPAVEGRWRWIGTRTLRFEATGDVDRLPAATEYSAVVPAGTTSESGGALADDVAWAFATPPPSVVRFVGVDETTALDPVFVAVFDQQIDPAAVLATTSLETNAGDVAIRLATEAEIEADADARNAMADALDGRAFAFTTTADLTPDASFTIRIGPGTPSAEGPLLSGSAELFTGRTFGSLRVVNTVCDQGDGCTPGTPFLIEFNNALDPRTFDAGLIDIEPAIPDLAIDVSGSSLGLSGATSARTTYTVTLDGALRDVFGETLGDDVELEFRVGSAPPTLVGLQEEWITTDPGATTPQVSVSSVNHDEIRVRVWAVTPEQLPEFREYQDALRSGIEPDEPAWSAVLDDTVAIEAAPDEWTETTIDLGDAFALSGSQVVVRIDPTTTVAADEEWRNRPTVAWVQSTTLAVDAFADDEHLVIWTTDLLTGEPVGGVPVELIGDGRVARTDAEGLVELELGESEIVALWATSGERNSLLPAFGHGLRGWQASPRGDETRWYLFDDRGVYRPGDTMRLTGWVRNLDVDEGYQLRRFDGDLQVDYLVRDSRGAEIASALAAVNDLGGFHLDVQIPPGANLGAAWVELGLVGTEASTQPATHSFAIQEFRRPEFEVSTRIDSPSPSIATEPLTVRVAADYFSGGTLSAAPVEWLVAERPTTYRPPNWEAYTFGVWLPWWAAEDAVGGAGDGGGADLAVEPCFDCGPEFATEYEEFSGTTDESGRHLLRVDFDRDGVDLPTAVTAEATVFDVNRQSVSSRTDVVVHAGRLYVGLRTERAFVELGTPIVVDAVLTDVDGGTVPDRQVTVTAGRVESVRSGGEWVEQIADEQTCTFTSSGDASDATMRCEFDTEVGGTYRISSTVVDDDGGMNRTELTQWVSGGTSAPPQRSVDLETATIIPDREEYAVGDTAEILVQAPFAPAHGVLTVLRGSLVSTEPFVAEDGSAVLEVLIDESWIPGVEIQVDLVGSAVRVDDDGVPVPEIPERPAFASGRIALDIPPATRTLEVIAEPAATELEPGDETTVTVTVLDADGSPVGDADVAVVVVDEAVLSLTGYELADPLDVFYTDIWSRWESTYLRSSVVLARSDLVGAGSEEIAERPATDGSFDSDGLEGGDGEATADEGAGGDASAGGAAIEIRTNLDPVAAYAPPTRTDADGRVTIDVPIPDNLTRYRVMAVAVAGDDQFGSGEASITARLPLQVRPSPPRFANFGDRFELPVVVQNQTGAPLEVDVALELANLESVGPTGQRVVVPAEDRVEVRFPVRTVDVGTARARVVAVSAEFADAATLALPVYTPATAEAFATHGVLDEGAVAQPTLAPSGVFPQFGGLEINLSSTALQGLTDAVLYLDEYPFESADALASRIMAIASLADVLDAFDAEGLPSPDELDTATRRDITALVRLQNDDGGFPTWERGRTSVPWTSIQSTHALVLARAAGYTVPEGSLTAALAHIADIETHIPADHPEEIRNTLGAYALAVRGVGGDRDAAKATALYDLVGDDLEPDALAWLWPSIDDADVRDEIARRLDNAAVETSGAATFATSYDETAYLIAHSDQRTDAVVLDALIGESPDSDLIPKVVAGLLAARTQGRWANVQENSFALIAMRHYFDTFESVTPDFVAGAWLGETYVAEAEFDGRSTTGTRTVVPMPDVVAAGDSTILLGREGVGRLYYRFALRYAPSDLRLDPREEGFAVERAYESVGDPDDVRRNDDGTWSIRTGATVRVTLTMVADARRTHVALVDPLPAGLEPLDPAAATTQTIPPEGDPSDASTTTWWANWFDHQNIRDDRAEAFATLLDGGTYEYSYLARATTPGEFVVPPTRAEEIFAPEVFGRSSTDRVTVG